MDWSIDEEGFTLYRPQRLRPWYNYLSNPDYGMKISHLGDAYATTLAEPRVAVSNYDFFSPAKGRYVYVNDGGELWSPSYYPCATELDEYRCRHSPWASAFRGVKNGIRVEQTVFLPRAGALELQLIRIENRAAVRRTIKIIPQMEFLLYNSFGIDPVYYSWYIDSALDADGRTLLFRKQYGAVVTGFFRASAAPEGYQASLRRFCGDGDPRRPEEALAGVLSNTMSGGDPYIGAFLFQVDLEPGEERTLAIAAGVAMDAAAGFAAEAAAGTGRVGGAASGLIKPDALARARAEFGTAADVERELAAVRRLWKERLDRPWYGDVAAGPFKQWLRTFFGAQIYQQSAGLVRSTYRGFRDVAQDAMGICRFEPALARRLLIELCARQYADGRCVRQWNTEGGAPDERDFRDLPFWISAALATYARLTGDAAIWQAEAPWLDDRAPAPLWRHAVRGAAYALRLGEHGLLEMGAGDWNDALSGPGPHGGTTFLNMFAYWALGLLDAAAGAAGTAGFDHGLDIAAWRDKLYSGVQRYWTGSRFARAVVGKDAPSGAAAGTVLGGGDGRVFLLPQAWFTISGMAERDPVRGKTALDTMLAELELAEGLLKCKPGFTAWDPAAGNLSALAPGMAENFAIYNHAAAFAAYALFQAGRDDEARRILRKVLPLYKDWRRTRAEPYVLVNFYNGGYRPEKLGEGGIPWLTGTINWVALCLWDFILPRNILLD